MGGNVDQVTEHLPVVRFEMIVLIILSIFTSLQVDSIGLVLYKMWYSSVV